MGSDGQFNFSAAGGTNTPSAIGAINDSIRQSAKDNAMIRKEMEDAEQHDWRVANANDSYQAINDLDPESDDYLTQLSDLDPRVSSLPGVEAKLTLQGQLHTAWKAEDTKRKENEEAMWAGMFDDARKFGTRDDVDALNEMRKDKSLGYEDARKFLGGVGGVYETKDKLEAKERSDAELESSRLKYEEDYKTRKDTLNQSWGGKLEERKRLKTRIANIEDQKDALDAKIEGNIIQNQSEGKTEGANTDENNRSNPARGAAKTKNKKKTTSVAKENQKHHNLDKTLKRLREELESLGLKEYDDAIDALNKGRSDFYAPEGAVSRNDSIDAVLNK